MGIQDDQHRKILDALARTKVVKSPQQYLHTFGVTNLRYYVVTEPSYSDIMEGPSESVIRDGSVTVQRPAVVTPTYMAHLEGFGDEARNYLDSLARIYGPNTPGILYQYKNVSGELNIVEGNPLVVAERISGDLHDNSNNQSVVLVGVDDLWDVSLLKFVFEYTLASLSGNIKELHSDGLLDPAEIYGVPRYAIEHIDSLFNEVEQGADPSQLKEELERWELFNYYQDRFLRLFRKKAS